MVMTKFTVAGDAVACDAYEMDGATYDLWIAGKEILK